MTHSNNACGLVPARVLTTVWVFLAVSAVWGATPLETAWTYQGELKQSGSRVNDTCDCQFSLWDDPAAGTQVGPTLTFDGLGGNPPPIAVNDGLFTVELDFGAGAFTGDARWLQIEVACPPGSPLTPLNPRQQLTAVPYALYALDGPGAGATPWQSAGSDIFYDAGKVGIGTAAPQHPLHVETSANEHAVFGHHTATSLARFGIAGQSDSTGGRGVFGLATSEIGLNTGVWGQTASSSGRGVLGLAAASTGSTFGVRGQSNSTEGTGVYAFALSSSGMTRGVHGQVNSSDGYAGYFEGGRNYFEGDVGIGTDSPQGSLDARGTVMSQTTAGDSDNFVFKKQGQISPFNVSFRLSHRASGSEAWMYGFDGSLFRNLQGWDYANNRVRFPADGDDLVIDQANGRVGIGTTTPLTELHVVGDAFITGDIVTIPRSRQISLTGADFQSETSACSILSNAGRAVWVHYQSQFLCRLFAPVRLPDGAELNSITALVRDESSTTDWSIRFLRWKPELDIGGSVHLTEVVAESTTNGTPGVTEVFIPVPPGQSTIDTSFSYWLVLGSHFDRDGPMEFHGVRIDYTVSHAGP